MQDAAAATYQHSFYGSLAAIPTNLAFFRQASTSDGSDEQIWGWVVVAEDSQFSGGLDGSTMAIKQSYQPDSRGITDRRPQQRCDLKLSLATSTIRLLKLR